MITTTTIIITMIVFTMREVEDGNTFLRKVVASSSLEMFKVRLDKSDLLGDVLAYHRGVGLDDL